MQGRLDIVKIGKTPLIYIASYFNFGGLGAWLGGHGRPQGGQNGHFPPWKLGLKTNIFLENLMLAGNFRLNSFNCCNYNLFDGLKHCTRARFTVVVSCNDEIAVRSCTLLCPQRQVAELASGLFDCLSLLRNDNTTMKLQTFTSSCGTRRFSACDQGSPVFFSAQICCFSRPGCLGLIMKNRVKSVFF